MWAKNLCPPETHAKVGGMILRRFTKMKRIHWKYSISTWKVRKQADFASRTVGTMHMLVSIQAPNYSKDFV